MLHTRIIKSYHYLLIFDLIHYIGEDGERKIYNELRSFVLLKPSPSILVFSSFKMTPLHFDVMRMDFPHAENDIVQYRKRRGGTAEIDFVIFVQYIGVILIEVCF